MTDRNGVEVRAGDRMLVLLDDAHFAEYSVFGAQQGYGRVTNTDLICRTGRCEGHQIAEVTMDVCEKREHVQSHEIELPVVAALTRRRECERQKRH